VTVKAKSRQLAFRLPGPRLPLLDRYLALEMVGPFLFGVGAFSSIALAIGSLFHLIRLVTDFGLNPAIAVRVFVLQLPGFMVYSFPMSMLLATMLAYSRLSGDGEMTALRSCGASVIRLLVPAVVLSLGVSALTFAFNEAIVPTANTYAENTLRIALNENKPTFRDRNIFYQQFGAVVLPDGTQEENTLVRSFYARRFDGRQMLDVTVLDYSQGGLQQILVAKSAVWVPTENIWLFRDGTNYVIGADGSYRSILRFDRQRLRLPRAPLDFAQEQRNPEQMNIRELSRYIALVGQSGNAKESRKLEVQLQQKYALPFICVVFATIGSPLGMRPQRTSSAKGFGLSVLIIFGYYLLLFVCRALGEVEVLSPWWGAWLPNVLGLGTGIFLIGRVT